MKRFIQKIFNLGPCWHHKDYFMVRLSSELGNATFCTKCGKYYSETEW